MAAARSPPAFDPAKIQFLRPIVTGRIALGDVVVDLGNALVDVAGERIPALAAIAERLAMLDFGDRLAISPSSPNRARRPQRHGYEEADALTINAEDITGEDGHNPSE